MDENLLLFVESPGVDVLIEPEEKEAIPERNLLVYSSFGIESRTVNPVAFGDWGVKCRVQSVECRVWSAECRVLSVECGVCGVECVECVELVECVECVERVECETRSVGVWSEEIKV